MKKILFVGPKFNPPTGGVAFVLREYKKLYPNARFVASTNSKNNLTKIFGFLFGFIHYVFLLTTQPNIQIVHIHGASYNSFTRKYLIYKLAKLFNKKVIYHIHGAEYQFFYEKSNQKIKKQIQNFINNTDCLICLSESWKMFFEQEFTPRRIEIIPNIIENPNVIPQKKVFASNTLKFLFLGYIDKRKGVWLLLDTLRKHKTEVEGKAVFYIGGNGEINRLQNLIKEYHLGNMVKYIGWVSGEEKQRQLNEADIYLLPSFNEGLPISILEAMSYSLPILSTTVGGIPEIIDNSNGILIEPGNEEQLWKAIEYFVNAEEIILDIMGQASKEKIKQHLPVEVRKKLNELYQNLIFENIS